MKHSIRFFSFLLAVVFSLSNMLNILAYPVFAASPMKKEKFLIKHASDDKLKQRQSDELDAIIDELQAQMP